MSYDIGVNGPISHLNPLNFLQLCYPNPLILYRFLLLHAYPAVLLALAAGYGTSVLGVKTNFHEGRWITGASVAIIPIYAVWMLTCQFAPPGKFSEN